MVENSKPKILLASACDPSPLQAALSQRGCLSQGTWHFDTKYYTADLQLVVNADAKHVEAIVFYFENTSDLLQGSFAQRIESLMQSHSPEIGIVFQNTGGKPISQTHPTELNAILAESFLEFVTEDLSQRVLQAAPSGLLGGDEATGVQRLVQALECTMWSNMVQKPQPQITDGVPRFDSLKPMKPEDIDQCEEQNESMVNLMHEMKRVQEANMQPGLSDEQRRKNAADIMAKFAQCMGLDGSDDSY